MIAKFENNESDINVIDIFFEQLMNHSLTQQYKKIIIVLATNPLCE
jgi:hypothetical protein